ncbi:MAG: glycoside hydrolase family 15 protein [bacterium]|nr:glycoside hydrolase family 15 protein [bacterium]
MGRPVVLSNGRMFVGLNKHGLVHDFYYPYVGLDNLTTTRSERHKIGIWVEGKFSWVNDGTWKMSVDFEDEALISKVIMRNTDLGVELHLQDFVDYELNAFGRHIKVINRANENRDIRIFMHQVYQISADGRADTALYEADGQYLLDYKGRTSLIIYGETSDGIPFDQYAVGNCGIEGKEGTYRDAEDGELSNNPVEHGGVDSVIRLRFLVPAKQAKTVDYWVAAASSQHDAQIIHDTIRKHGLATRLRDTRRWWRQWMDTAESSIRQIDEQYQAMTRKSLLVIKAHIDRRGSVLASGDSSIFNYGRDYYGYCWPRDGALSLWPLLRVGYTEEIRNFFEFCRDIMHEDGYMLHKYLPDRSIGSTWHPTIHNNRHELAIQEDETAIVLIMMGEYLKVTRDSSFVEQLYGTFIKPTAYFLASYIDEKTNLPHASYDLWEEKFLTSTYTTATVYGALIGAARFAELFDHPDDALAWKEAAKRIENSIPQLFNAQTQSFRKGLMLQANGKIEFDETLDASSMYGMMMFGPESALDMVHLTMNRIEQVLLDDAPAGGVARYEHDNYMRNDDKFLGNPWINTTLWVAQYYLQNDKIKRAHAIMEWAENSATASGVLSEQVYATDGTQASVSPLIWSHAEYVNTALDLAGL